MSRFITFYISNDIILEKVNEISYKNNLKFTMIENNLDENNIMENVNCYIGEWICNQYDDVILNEITSEEILRNLTNLGYKIDEGFIERLNSEKLISRMSVKENKKNLTSFAYNFLSVYPWSEIGFIVHWYENSVESEKITIKNVVEITINNRGVRLKNLQEDTLYIFKGDNGDGSDD